MTIVGKVYWCAECDCCGTDTADGDGAVLYPNAADAWASTVEEGDWRLVDGQHLCDRCWTYGEEEPIRAHTKHALFDYQRALDQVVVRARWLAERLAVKACERLDAMTPEVRR